MIKPEPSQLQESLRTRANINIDYDRAAIFYWEGDLASARTAFANAMTQAKNFGRQLLASYAQNYLADIAINQGNYEEAEFLLEPGLTMVERNKEKRRISSYKRSFAYLRQKQGKLDEALLWAQQAKEGSECLGATQEVHKMERLIQDLRRAIGSQSR